MARSTVDYSIRASVTKPEMRSNTADLYAFTVQASAYIHASPAVVFDHVSDVTRFGDWSPECVGGEWITPGPAPGARFYGHNRSPRYSWTTECEVLVADRPWRFEWHVITNAVPGTSIWRYEIAADGSRCRVTETFEMTALPHPLRAALERESDEQKASLLEGRKRELLPGIEQTLAKLKTTIESATQPHPSV